MDRKVEEIEFTVFDTETTGLEPEAGDRIVEIAAIRFKGKDKISEFQSLVNPGRPVSEAAQTVNHITFDMLKDAPAINSVMPRFLDFCSGTCLLSYNAAFDMAFLRSELKFLGKADLDLTAVDILRMARRLLPGFERYALWFVADKLGIGNTQCHRALADAELAWEVFIRLNDILKAKNILTFRELLSLFGVSSALLSDINNKKLAEIQQAIDLGVKLKIKYLAGVNAQVSERQVIPKEIRQDKERVYLVGHCCLRQEERTFRVDGILHLEIV